MAPTMGASLGEMPAWPLAAGSPANASGTPGHTPSSIASLSSGVTSFRSTATNSAARFSPPLRRSSLPRSCSASQGKCICWVCVLIDCRRFRSVSIRAWRQAYGCGGATCAIRFRMRALGWEVASITRSSNRERGGMLESERISKMYCSCLFQRSSELNTRCAGASVRAGRPLHVRACQRATSKTSLYCTYLPCSLYVLLSSSVGSEMAAPCSWASSTSPMTICCMFDSPELMPTPMPGLATPKTIVGGC
eukprot:scaffold93708_cov72-Phaeocystis_antarctica.AAC.6